MKNLFITLTLFLSGILGAQGQVIFQEGFESAGLPAGWSIQTDATDGGWKIGTPTSISSQFWPVTPNGSIRIAGTNDDACNCDKSNDYLVTPVMDFSGLTSIALKFDMYFGANTYQGATEHAYVEVSLNGTDWEVLEELHGHGEWDSHTLDLSGYAGEDTVFVGFHYSDGGGWLYGLAIDNVSFEVPPALDAQMVELNERPFGEENTSFPISGHLFNGGVSPITSLEITISINGALFDTEVFDNLNIDPFGFYEIQLSTPWVPAAAGIYEVAVEIISVNGGADENQDNNALSFETEIFEKVVPPNRIDEFLLADPVFTEVATSADQLDKPTDLDFFPIMGKDELWVVNERNESSGGSTLTINNASTEAPEYLSRVDGNAWHFMSLPTGIAFSENFNFATSPGVKDANHSNGTFTGPTLWSSDPNIYAQPSGGNGSHLDMLHGSPYSMGIAHETANVFWVFDGWNETIVRYDFKNDHGPGNDDHSDAIVRRYTEIQVKKDGVVPSHLVLDKATGWMYVVDNGNHRVLRLDINSGSVAGNLPMINEQLAEHSEMANVTWEVIIQDSIEQPCGIEVMENRLLVGDYASGDIYVYDIENNFEVLGRISTGQAGLTGIKVGPDGSIWYTNRLQNSLVRVEPAFINSTEEEALAAQVKISPNPTSGSLLVGLPDTAHSSGTTIELSDLTGKKIMTLQGVGGTQQLHLNGLSDGMYLISVRNSDYFTTRKIILKNN